jgi:hypothetical protein
MSDNWMIRKVKEYLENNIENILDGFSDETISKLFDMSKNFIIEARHLKKEVTLLKKENAELNRKLIAMKEKKG